MLLKERRVGEREGDFPDDFIKSENFDPVAKKFNLLFTKMLTISVMNFFRPGSLISIKTKEPRYGPRKRKRKGKKSVNRVLPRPVVFVVTLSLLRLSHPPPRDYCPLGAELLSDCTTSLVAPC